ncbi:MAG: glycosyltransferase [Elusimicrobia bacterium]|nr:glycosyltransferase [Elusimicrobiota bacterium]
MRRLLLVTYAFPPVLTAEAINVTRTLRALEDLGWTATVLTADPKTVEGPRDPGLSERLPRSVEVHVAPTIEGPFRRAYRAPLRLMLHAGLPEEQILWYPQAVAAGTRLVSRERAEVMLSWASYHASNVVGLALHARSGIPWVAHSSDPWTRSLYFPCRPLQRLTAGVLERAIFQRADALTFTTRETVELVMADRPAAWRAKAVVVPHGHEGADEALTARSAGGPLRLVHAGQFYKGMRTPLPLIAAIAELNQVRPLAGRLELLLVGPAVPEHEVAAHRLGVDDIVRFAGQASALEARRASSRADVLVVIDAPSRGPSVFLPTKLVEYLPLGKPILGLTPESGASANLLRRAGCAVVPPDDPVAIAAALRALLDAYEASGWTPPSPPPSLAHVARGYEIRRTAARLAGVLEDVAAGRPTSSTP